MAAELQSELTTLRRTLLSMGASTEQRVRDVYAALLSRDTDRARRVKQSDDEIDRLDLDIESECLRILALHHPVASDLRFVLSALRIETELERIADMARGIAKRVIKICESPAFDFPGEIADMTRHSELMLGAALRALADNNEAIANQVRRDDKAVDADLRLVYQWAVSRVANQTEAARGIIDLLFIARSIERIADLTTNIAEAAIFIVGGEIVRHKPVPAN